MASLWWFTRRFKPIKITEEMKKRKKGNLMNDQVIKGPVVILD